MKFLTVIKEKICYRQNSY